MKKLLLLILLFCISNTFAQKNYTANDHVAYNRTEKNGKYIVSYTFKDYHDKLVSLTAKFDKKAMDKDINIFGIPKSMFEPYTATPEIEKRRAKQLKDGLFKSNGNTISIDKNAFISEYRKYCKPIAEWMVSYLKSRLIDTRRERIELAIKFVQDIPYAIPTDRDPNWSYGGVNPIPEILITGWGDCDSKAFLFAGILSYLIDYRDIRFAGEPGHLYTLIKNDKNNIVKNGTTTYFTLNGKYFLAAETAGPGRFDFGEAGKSEYNSAKIEKLNLGNISPIPFAGSSAVATQNLQTEVKNHAGSGLSELNKLIKDAEEGDNRAQQTLANKYYFGENVPKDIPKALYWYKKLAAAGNSYAQMKVADILYFGEGGVPKNVDKAIYYYKILAEKGDAMAKYRLATAGITGVNSSSNERTDNNSSADDNLSENTDNNNFDKITTTGSKVTPEDARKIVDEHNRIRADVGVGPVTWSDKLATFAQDWADQLAANGCAFEHRPNNKYGENIYEGTKGFYTVVHSVEAWESEKQNYTYGPSGTTQQAGVVGHYTQIIWRNTKKIGCGVAECNGMIIVVCNYDPPGNYTGEKPY